MLVPEKELEFESKYSASILNGNINALLILIILIFYGQFILLLF